jgi:hypothetical protein
VMKLYDIGAERMEKEFDLLHIVKNLRNIKNVVKNQFTEMYLASKFQHFAMIDLDNSDDEKAIALNSSSMIIKGLK